MADKIPTWVDEYTEEYNQFYKKNKIFSLIGLIFIIIGLSSIILNKDEVDIVGLIFFGFGTYLYVIYYSKKLPYPLSNYLSSMFYSIGIGLEQNSDSESKIYLNNMDKHLKNCGKIIKGINYSLREGLYIKNTSAYTKKLHKLIKLLNNFYDNYSNSTIEKSEIAKKIIQLADLMHGDKEFITDAHFNLIDSITNDLTNNNVEEKRLYTSKTKNIKNIFIASINSIPYTLKLLIYVILILIIS